MTQEDHFDVAAYALGVLDARDAARFEDHLLECPSCSHELDSFVQVADLLADVDAGAVIAAEETRREGIVLQKMMGEVRHERHRQHSRRLYSLAAAVIVFAMLSIGAFFFGRAGGEERTPANTTAGNSTKVVQQPDNNPGDGVGIGGPDLAGTPYEATDPRTDVSAAMGLEKKDFGTKINIAISKLQGEKVCRLVVVHRDGSTEPLDSWRVGEKGWGTDVNPQPLELSPITATPIEDISHVLVQEVKANGELDTLVRLMS